MPCGGGDYTQRSPTSLFRYAAISVARCGTGPPHPKTDTTILYQPAERMAYRPRNVMVRLDRAIALSLVMMPMARAGRALTHWRSERQTLGRLVLLWTAPIRVTPSVVVQASVAASPQRTPAGGILMTAL